MTVAFPADSDEAHEAAVEVRGVFKRFKVYHRPVGRIADMVMARPGRFVEVWALRDISFAVKRGECFGIVGSNGSGKSTLLKLITQTLLQTKGEISVHGRVLALLELGGGINPELTGRDNVNASATLLGFPPGYAASRMAEIEAFADIGEFFDRPMRIYSSGMYVRLAFSLYLFMDPDILIVDEALSVGDIFFQQKCYEALRAIMKRGTTVLFVSHDTGAVQKLCDRALVLDQGEVAYIGRPDEAVNRYHTLLGNRHARRTRPAGAEVGHAPPGDGIGPTAAAIVAENVLQSAPLRSRADGLALTGMRLINRDGQPTMTFKMGETICLQFVLDACADTRRPDIAIAIFDRFNVLVFRTSAARAGYPLNAMKSGERTIVEMRLGSDLQMGGYTLRVGLLDDLDDATPSESIVVTPVVIHWGRPPSPFYGQIGLACRLADASPRAAGG